MQRPAVVLPQPLSPTSPSVSPRRMLKLTSSTALTWPTTRLRTPRRMGKYILRFFTSNKWSVSISGFPLVLIRVQRAAHQVPWLDLHQGHPGRVLAGGFLIFHREIGRA